jgi:hypothetical protein
VLLQSRPVLVAAIPAAAERLCRLLSDQRVVSPATLPEAQAALARERFALAVMGVHFAESRMFDLISYARASALNRDVRIVCVLGVRRNISPLTVHLLQETIDAMPGCVFLNLVAIPDHEGGNVLVRGTLMEYLQPPLSPGIAATVRPLHQVDPSST